MKCEPGFGKRTAVRAEGRAGWSFLYVTVMLVLLADAAPNCPAQVLSWEPNVARAFTYSVTIEHGLKEGHPEFTEHFTLTLRFLGDGRVEITRQGRAPVTFQTTSGGNLRITNSVDTPPYIAVLLLNSLPAAPTKLEPQATWETRFPTDADLSLEGDKIALQDRLLGRVRETGTTSAFVDLEGQVRAIHNRATNAALGQSLATFENLFRWNLYLTGSLELDSIDKSPKRAKFYYVLLPMPELTKERLMKEQSLQHAVVERVE